MTPFQIMTAIRNTREQPRNIAPQVKAALDNKKTSPEGLASNDITTDYGVGAPNTSTGGASRCVPLF